MWFCFCRAFVFSISQVLVGSAPLKPYGFDKGCKHTYIHKVQVLIFSASCASPTPPHVNSCCCCCRLLCHLLYLNFCIHTCAHPGLLPRQVYLFDGPDAEVEFWGDLRAGQPDPIMVAKLEPQVWEGGAFH